MGDLYGVGYGGMFWFHLFIWLSKGLNFNILRKFLVTNLRNESGISSNKGIGHLDVCADSVLFKTCFPVPVSSCVSPFPLLLVQCIRFYIGNLTHLKMILYRGISTDLSAFLNIFNHLIWPATSQRILSFLQCVFLACLSKWRCP